MYGTNHVLVGAAVGSLFQSPALGALAGFCAHAVCDAVPHHDYSPSRRPLLFTDGFLSGTIVLLLALTGQWPAVLGGFFGALPDAEGFLQRWGLMQRSYYPSHSGLTPHPRLDLPWGFWLQTSIGLAAGACLIWRIAL